MLVDRARPRARQRHAPVVAVDTHANEVDRADAEVGVKAAALGKVADGVVAPANTLAKDPRHAGAEGDDAEERFQKSRLAGAVRAEDRDELLAVDRQGGVAPYGAAADLDGGAIE